MREYGFSPTRIPRIKTELQILSLYGKYVSVKTRILAYIIQLTYFSPMLHLYAL